MAIEDDSWKTLSTLLGAAAPEDFDHDFGRITRAAKALPVKGSYDRIGPLHELFDQFKKKYGDAVVELYARQLLLESLADTYWRPCCRVPETVTAELAKERQRIRREIFEQPLGHYLPTSDGFYKDFSLLRGKSLPVFTGIVDTHLSIWRRPLLVGSIAQRIRFLFFLLRKPVGRRFFLQHHTHTSLLSNFNLEGWNRTYKLVTDIVEMNTDHKGFCGASWFYDPEIERVSPRLAYLAGEPIAHGAVRFYLERDKTGSALSKSNTRRSLYEQGQYTPQKYLLLWHRADLLKWRDSLCSL